MSTTDKTAEEVAKIVINGPSSTEQLLKICSKWAPTVSWTEIQQAKSATDESVATKCGHYWGIFRFGKYSDNELYLCLAVLSIMAWFAYSWYKEIEAVTASTISSSLDDSDVNLALYHVDSLDLNRLKISSSSKLPIRSPSSSSQQSSPKVPKVPAAVSSTKGVKLTRPTSRGRKSTAVASEGLQLTSPDGKRSGRANK